MEESRGVLKRSNDSILKTLARKHVLQIINSNPSRGKRTSKIKPNAFANQVVEMTRASIDTTYSGKVAKELKKNK